MPIQFEELNLPLSEYELLQDAPQDAYPVWKVVAHQYNPKFYPQLWQSNFINDRRFAATYIPGIDRVAMLMPDPAGENNGFGLYLLDGVNFTTLEPPEEVSVNDWGGWFFSSNSERPTLYAEGNFLHIYWPDFHWGISGYTVEFDASGNVLSSNYNEYSVDGTLQDEPIIKHAVMVAEDRFHLILYNINKKTSQLCSLEYNAGTGTWETFHSNIHYMYPIQSFDAVAIDGHDVITICTQTPGITSVRSVGDQVEKYIEISGGILSFIYQERSWSDHYNVDVVDNITNVRVRRDIHLTKFDDLIVATAYTTNATEDYPFSAYRIYTSKDGRHWSLGRILPTAGLSSPGTRGLKLVRHGDYVHAISPVMLMASSMTMMLGHSPDDMQIDLTDDIVDYSFTQERTAQCNIAIDNEDGAYNDHPIINEENTIALVHYAGYHNPDTGEDVLIQFALTEVDTLDFTDSNPERTLTLTARDRIAWMSDKYGSEEAYYWEGQLMGGDRYTDDTVTGYGGMRHTAVKTGTWHTKAMVLLLRNNNEEGVSFNTFSPYIWNGCYRGDVRVSEAGEAEYVGLIFRAMDKDNMWFARYNQETDRIELYERVGGTDTLHAQSDVLGIVGIAAFQFFGLQVRFYYGYIRVDYQPPNSYAWETVIEYYPEGVTAAESVSGVLDRGYVGQLGYGYSEEDEWTFPEFELPDLEWTVPDWNVEFPDIPYLLIQDISYLPPLTATSVQHGLTTTRAERLLYSSTVHTTSPFWSVVYQDGIVGAAFAYWSGVGASSQDAWAITRENDAFGIALLSSVNGVPTKTLRGTFPYVITEENEKEGVLAINFAVSLGVIAINLWTIAGNVIVYSTNNGVSFTVVDRRLEGIPDPVAPEDVANNETPGEFQSEFMKPPIVIKPDESEIAFSYNVVSTDGTGFSWWATSVIDLSNGLVIDLESNASLNQNVALYGGTFFPDDRIALYQMSPVYVQTSLGVYDLILQTYVETRPRTNGYEGLVIDICRPWFDDGENENPYEMPHNISRQSFGNFQSSVPAYFSDTEPSYFERGVHNSTSDPDHDVNNPNHRNILYRRITNNDFLEADYENEQYDSSGALIPKWEFESRSPYWNGDSTFPFTPYGLPFTIEYALVRSQNASPLNIIEMIVNLYVQFTDKKNNTYNVTAKFQIGGEGKNTRDDMAATILTFPTYYYQDEDFGQDFIELLEVSGPWPVDRNPSADGLSDGTANNGLRYVSVGINVEYIWMHENVHSVDIGILPAEIVQLSDWESGMLIKVSDYKVGSPTYEIFPQVGINTRPDLEQGMFVRPFPRPVYGGPGHGYATKHTPSSGLYLANTFYTSDHAHSGTWQMNLDNADFDSYNYGQSAGPTVYRGNYVHYEAHSYVGSEGAVMYPDIRLFKNTGQKQDITGDLLDHLDADPEVSDDFPKVIPIHVDVK